MNSVNKGGKKIEIRQQKGNNYLVIVQMAIRPIIMFIAAHVLQKCLAHATPMPNKGTNVVRELVHPKK